MSKQLSEQIGAPIAEQHTQLKQWLAEADLPVDQLPDLNNPGKGELAPDELPILCMYLPGPDGLTDLDATADFYLKAIATQAAGLGIRVNHDFGPRYFWGKLWPVGAMPEPGLHQLALNLGTEPGPQAPTLASSIGLQLMRRRRPAGLEVLALLAHSETALRKVANAGCGRIPLGGLKVDVPDGEGANLVPTATGHLKSTHPHLFLNVIRASSIAESGWRIPTVRPVL